MEIGFITGADLYGSEYWTLIKTKRESNSSRGNEVLKGCFWSQRRKPYQKPNNQTRTKHS
jgi:hypothetical protein